MMPHERIRAKMPKKGPARVHFEELKCHPKHTPKQYTAAAVAALFCASVISLTLSSTVFAEEVSGEITEKDTGEVMEETTEKVAEATGEVAEAAMAPASPCYGTWQDGIRSNGILNYENHVVLDASDLRLIAGHLDQTDLHVTSVEGNVNLLAGTLSEMEDEMGQLKKSVSDGKALVASAITDCGVSTESDATFQTLADNVYEVYRLGYAKGYADAQSDMADYQCEYLYHIHSTESQSELISFSDIDSATAYFAEHPAPASCAEPCGCYTVYSEGHTHTAACTKTYNEVHTGQIESGWVAGPGGAVWAKCHQCGYTWTEWWDHDSVGIYSHSSQKTINVCGKKESGPCYVPGCGMDHGKLLSVKISFP